MALDIMSRPFWRVGTIPDALSHNLTAAMVLMQRDDAPEEIIRVAARSSSLVLSQPRKDGQDWTSLMGDGPAGMLISPTVETHIMALSPAPDSQDALFVRMRTLLNQMDDRLSQTPEYDRLSAEIHELAKASCAVMLTHSP